MINQIMDLVIAYPSFQLNTIIDPEQANINNQQIVQKINFVAKEFNKLTLPGSSGASKITILPFADVTATEIQTALQQIMAFIKAYIASNNISVSDLYAKIGLNTTSINAINAKNTEQDTRLTNIESVNTAQNTRLTNVETKNIEQDTRLTNVETKNTQQDNRLTTIEPIVASNTSRIQTIESKEAQIETRLYNAEIADGLNEAIVQDIDIRTTNTDNALVGLQTEFNAFKSVNVNAELVDARTSNLYGTFSTVGQRVNFTEAKIDDVQVSADTQIANINLNTGNKANLLTSVKTNLVSAINSLLELATNAVDGLMSKTDKEKLDGISPNANNYVHPTTAGNIHIPTGGAVGNFVKYSSSGVGVWATPTKTDVGLGSVLNYGVATTAQAEAGTVTTAYMTPALTASAISKLASGGDYVGKVYNVERIITALSGGVTQYTLKSYTNAKGGIVRAYIQNQNATETIKITVDGAVKYDGLLAGIGLSGFVVIPFNTSFSLVFTLGTSSYNHTTVLHYYTNP